MSKKDEKKSGREELNEAKSVQLVRHSLHIVFVVHRLSGRRTGNAESNTAITWSIILKFYKWKFSFSIGKNETNKRHRKLAKK